MDIETITARVLNGAQISREEALFLYEQPLAALSEHADRIRQAFCGDAFDLCTIINAKSGRCSENCAFCAQSAHHHTGATEYPLLSTEEIVAQAQINHDQGVLRFSLVTSGKRLSDTEVEQICDTVRAIRREVGIAVCVSVGLLDEANFCKLKAAGVSRVHNNLETSRRYFPNVCTTHSFDDKVQAIRAAQAAGLEVCSGGIMGLGETPEDRIDLALSLRVLGVKSMPVNLLNPIPGTPLAANATPSADELRRCVAVFRFILPDAAIRLAGGRGLLPDKGRNCFRAGANAAISGNMLTTSGITTATDRALLDDLGYSVRFS